MHKLWIHSASKVIQVCKVWKEGTVVMLLCGELFPGSPDICSDEQVSPCLLLTTQSWVSCLMGCIFLSIFWGITYFHPPLIWTQVEALMPFPEKEYWKQWGSCYSQVPSADSMDHTGKILTKTEWTILSPCLWEQKLTILSCFFPSHLAVSHSHPCSLSHSFLP